MLYYYGYMNISLQVQTSQGSRPGAYRTDMTVTSASNDTTIYLFVKQRILNIDGTTDDTFIAVAGPAEIEDLPQQAPVAPSTIFRDSTISLISSDQVALQAAVQNILNDLLLTMQQGVDLETFTSVVNYTVDSSAGISP